MNPANFKYSEFCFGLRLSREVPFPAAAFHLHFGCMRLDCGVEEFVDIQCPYCGQTCEVVIDTSFARQRFPTDCEVCCRPFQVAAECEDGKVTSAEATVD